MKELLSSAARLTAAEQAYRDGDIQLASRLFMSVARSRPATPVSEKAKQRLTELANEAKQKIDGVNDRLSQTAQGLATTEMLGLDGPLAPQWKEVVTTAFEEYDKLGQLYGSVPNVRTELKSLVTQKQRRPEYAAVLNEPKAAALCEVAREHEREQQGCCAFWVYKEAAELIPAPSARIAAEELVRMGQDQELMAAAESCRRLQECHRLYNRAESLVKMWPSRSEELLAQVIEIAPPDSEIYHAARQRVETIRKVGSRGSADDR